MMVFLAAWFCAVYAIFGIAHSKLASYILPLFPPLAVALALALDTSEERRRRTLAAASMFVVFGAGLVAVPFAVKGALAADLRPVLLVVAGFGVVQIACAALLALRRPAPAIILNAVGFLGVVIAATLSLPPSATAGFTDADTARIVKEEGLAGQTVVASKLYARGVYFHSGSPIAVMDRRPNPFWSPHPVEVLWQDEQLRAFFGERDKVLCVVRPGDVERLDRLFAGVRTQRVLSSAFERMVVLSVRN